MKQWYHILIALTFSISISSQHYHVTKTGNDKNNGMQKSPFLTIQKAANNAQSDDVINVREGMYRERVNPPRGGIPEDKRIVSQAVYGERLLSKDQNKRRFKDY